MILEMQRRTYIDVTFHEVEEEVLNGVIALRMADMWEGWRDCKACFERAKEEFVRLLGENCAKAVRVTFHLVRGSIDESIAEFRRL